ncbi:UDP-N-acetylglucosamine 2-epimerase (hydrolyzing) [Clostridium botulinum]|uniref:UDP-N-acetylglucosamine 2-epimerase (Hydrolyzing) n=2 Tax=Clostridium botulinum TaxID=1491 RepID=A0A6B4BHS4_CLOBO|nr:UDP-N-acetylglucosamine 2-epimerase [Clostridium botulinum]ABS41610.1 putative UDP-N-acetylglucosamine 2-epimerase [Clostridium botulinum F str. Langeland]ADG00398.1 putative UDP-N-acetylglucosamine 2-epimerase [Clostridium botulinum F str. 230613]KEI79478.1 UDP-N-acetylglucosamine 2-epimerase [Clostridium botulinum A2 117]KKM41111.1 UDP-N-acetylglucosamine 2-epimerase [Clostridium botulinum]MBN3416548.1 UDP-N-acetylglucosamine 2-epimerase (hydrolyzing) [Clostridium botulinum]
MKRKIAVVTGSRSEFGILYWVIKELEKCKDIECQLIVTGSHLAPSQGYTINQIYNCGFEVNGTVPMLLDGDSDESIGYSIGIGIMGMTKELKRLNPDIVLILGDRFEIFSVATAAMALQIPIAHIGGGETDWANCIDGNIRNAITKMANIHFVSTQQYVDRIIKMGEEPWRVFQTGMPSLDNIKDDLLSKDELEENLDVKFEGNIFLVTYLPVGLRIEESIEELKKLLKALGEFNKDTIIFTLSNADAGGRKVNQYIKEFCKNNNNAHYFPSLGKKRYLSMLNTCNIVIGNSSSGIIETPSFKKATINVGIRQNGRIHPNNVIDVIGDKHEIIKAINRALYDEGFKIELENVKNPFGDGNASKRIVKILKNIEINKSLIEKKLV